jgi:hypothetical protein
MKPINESAENSLLRQLDLVAAGNVDVGTGNCIRSAASDYRVELLGRICDLAAMVSGSSEEELWRPGNIIWGVASEAYRSHFDTLPPPGLFDALEAMEREFGRGEDICTTAQIAAIAGARRALATASGIKPATEPCAKLDPQGSPGVGLSREATRKPQTVQRDERS